MKWIFITLGSLVLVGVLIYAIGYFMSIGHTATVEKKFKINKDELWDILTNYKGYTEWRRGIKELIVDDADQWTEINDYGDIVHYQLEIAEEKRIMTIRIMNKDLPYGGFWEFIIDPQEEGCSLKITESGEVYSPVYRFMSKYIFGHDTTLKNYMEDLETKVNASVKP